MCDERIIKGGSEEREKMTEHREKYVGKIHRCVFKGYGEEVCDYGIHIAQEGRDSDRRRKGERGRGTGGEGETYVVTTTVSSPLSVWAEWLLWKRSPSS